jgi:SsrA-binding protein
MKRQEKILSLNRKALYLFLVKDKFEAGVVLTGEEVKSIRKGKININAAFVGEAKGELYLMNSSIAKYDKATTTEHEEKRRRKILLHKKQINKIIGSIKAPGYSAVVLKVYTNSRNKIKLDIAIVRGKSEIDKRDAIKEREWKREKSKMLKLKNSKTN